MTKKRKRSDDDSDTAYQLEIPDDAKLTYHIYVKDKVDNTDLSPPAVYRHSDDMITRGAFSYLKSSLEAAGHLPTFEILTPNGRRIICNESEWEQAVVAIYNRRRSGGSVEIDIYI
jgi:hypothetical protein